MTSDRDTFAAAALMGLLAQGDDGSFSEESYARAAYRWADAMLRQRGNHIPDAGKMAGTPRTPQSDRLAEWERHGSRRWGLGVASDLYDLECRVAVLEKANHDAAPAARVVSDEARTDKAEASHRRDGTGDTPETQTTPGECSKPRECTEPVAWAVVSGSREEIDCEFVFPDEATAGDVALDTNGGVVPLYRHPPCQDFSQKNLTLTDAEREAVEASRDFWEVEADAFSEPRDGHYAATLRGLLERTK